MTQVYDFIGIGVGPFNLSLAALTHPLKNCKALFFEKNPLFNWHPGMLLDDAKLQVPFLADMVTMSDPTNPFSFLAYLHKHQRLYKFYFLEDFHVSRQEYNHYCQWVAEQLPNVFFSHEVLSVQREKHLLKVGVRNGITQQEQFFYTKHLVIGVGSIPDIPEHLADCVGEYVQHSANFIPFANKIAAEQSIAVIGSGQSAAEIVLQLLTTSKKIYWVSRAPGFFPMEYSKLGLELFSPDYMRYFYHLSSKMRGELIPRQGLLYKGISEKTIAAIFDKLYQLTIANQLSPLTLLANSELKTITLNNSNDYRFQLNFTEHQQNENYALCANSIILATGFRPLQPNFLALLAEELVTDESQAYALNSDFSIKTHKPWSNKIFLQNNSFYSHGVGSPDLGLGCYRNNIIINSILEKEHYPIHQTNVFQTFGVPHQEIL